MTFLNELDIKTDNILIYLNILESELVKLFEKDEDLAVDTTFIPTNLKQVNGYWYYKINVAAKRFSLLSYKELMDGPMSKIITFAGVGDILIGNYGLIEIVYPISFFENDEYFKSQNCVMKYKL